MENEENKILVDLKKKPLRSEREEIRNRRLKIFMVFMLCLFFLVAGMLAGVLISGRPGNDKESSGSSVSPLIPSSSTPYSEIQRVMDRYWLYGDQYEDLDKELENKALYGMTAFDFDPYTTYMSEEEMNSFSDSINGSYVGIGVEYTDINGKALIKKVFKFSPAEKAGLLAGDIISEVDGVSIIGMSTQEIKERVLGIEGTVVTLRIERGSEEFDVDVIRGVVNSTVFAYTENDYIIMELNSFGETTADECMKYLDAYPDYDKIIIDLRDDSGGYQTAVRDICGIFIGPDEVYLRQKSVDGTEAADRTLSTSRKYDFSRIVLLTSEDTASAAEVFAIVLREKCDNVTIVGKTTYGKGVIQTNRLLSNGGVLKITTYYWYSPNGVSINKEGVHPDIEISMPEIYYQYYSDMAEDEYYEYDQIGEPVRIAELALSYLDYDVDRTDGYFSKSFEEALIRYQKDYDIDPDGILDRDTFGSIVASTRRELSNNTDKDPQFQKAKEIMNEDQH